MLENLETLEADGRLVRLLQRNEAAPTRELDNERETAMRDAPKVRGDLWVSRLNAEPEADMIEAKTMDGMVYQWELRDGGRGEPAVQEEIRLRKRAA